MARISWPRRGPSPSPRPWSRTRSNWCCRWAERCAGSCACRRARGKDQIEQLALAQRCGAKAHPGAGAEEGRGRTRTSGECGASRTIAVAGLCACLSACGFQLRGQATLRYQPCTARATRRWWWKLKRNLIAGTNSKLVPNEKDAQAILGFTNEVREKVILSFNTSGLVREYPVALPRGFPALRRQGAHLHTGPTRSSSRANVSFNEGQVLAKEAEDALLYRDMQADMVQQILRRLVAARAPADE